MRTFVFVAIIFCLSLSGKAEDSLSVGGQTFPLKIDLSAFFANRPDAQGNEASCHIYAAAALAEAYCNRITSKDFAGAAPLRVSTEYLKYRHLRSNLLTFLSADEFTDDLVNPVVDAGLAENSLQRIFDGSVLTEDEFPSDRGLEKLFTEIRKTQPNLKTPANINAVNQRLDQFFESKLSEKNIRAQMSFYGGEWATSQNPRLVQCLARRPEIIKDKFNALAGLQLISRGSPFIWFGPWTVASGENAIHAVLVDGYRVNSKLDPKKYFHRLEYHVRDSDTGQSRWGFGLPAEGGVMVYLGNQKLTQLRDHELRYRGARYNDPRNREPFRRDDEPRGL